MFCWIPSKYVITVFFDVHMFDIFDFKELSCQRYIDWFWPVMTHSDPFKKYFSHLYKYVFSWYIKAMWNFWWINVIFRHRFFAEFKKNNLEFHEFFLPTSLKLVFCYQNCYDLLWEKIVLVIEKKFWNSRLKAKNLQKIWDH